MCSSNKFWPLFDQQTLATARSKTVHIAYAFQHTAGQQINLFSTQWMIFWFWKDVPKLSTLHMHLAHNWSTNQSLFHSMNDILILKRCCKETWSSHSTKQTSAVHKTVPMTMSKGEGKLQRSSKWYVNEHFKSKMHKSEWGRVFWINITLLPEITKTWRLSFKYSTCKEMMT